MVRIGCSCSSLVRRSRNVGYGRARLVGSLVYPQVNSGMKLRNIRKRYGTVGHPPRRVRDPVGSPRPGQNQDSRRLPASRTAIGGGGLLDEPSFPRQPGEVGPGAHEQLALQGGPVALYRPRRDAQPSGDLAVRQARSDKGQDLQLA
jgi:hypothetical protein